MNRNPEYNTKINIQNNNENIQNAFLTIISELNSKDLIIRELESQVNYQYIIRTIIKWNMKIMNFMVI